MGSFPLTVIAAVLLMGCVMVGLAVGFLLTGKNRLKRGCGYTPRKSPKDSSSCSVCGKNEPCESEKKDASKRDH